MLGVADLDLGDAAGEDRAAVLRVRVLLEGVLHVLRVERLAVVELHAFTEVEAPGRGVDGLPLLGQQADRLELLALDAQQAVEEVLLVDLGGEQHAGGRVQALALLADGHHPLGLGGLGTAGAGPGRQAHRSDRDRRHPPMPEAHAGSPCQALGRVLSATCIPVKCTVANRGAGPRLDRRAERSLGFFRSRSVGATLIETRSRPWPTRSTPAPAKRPSCSTAPSSACPAACSAPPAMPTTWASWSSTARARRSTT